MDLNELNALVKVVQAGSFTRAAETLSTQKAHLSRIITNLERKLGVRLLVRSTRSLSLTEIGREMFERAVGILAAVEETERVVQQMHAEPRGILKMTCGVEFGMIAVSGWINAYAARYPQVVVEADFSGRLIDLVHEGFDLAIRLGDLPDSSLAARRIGELDYGLFASPDYLAQHNLPFVPEDLMQHQLLVFSGGSHRNLWRFMQGANEKKVELTPRLRINNIFAIRDAALHSLGIAQLPLLIGQRALKSGQLIQVLPEWNLPVVPVNALFPSNRYLTPKVRLFIDEAIELFQKGHE